MEMKDQVIAISGGTSGIGLATAKLLIQQGARVSIAGRSLKKGEAALAELGERASYVSIDVKDSQACSE